MTKKLLATTTAVLTLLPALAFAQTANVTGDVTAAATAQTPAGTVKAGASASLSATVVATAKSRADKEIDRRVAALSDIVTRINAMTRVTADFKTQVTTNLQGQITALNNLKAKIDADTDDTTLKADVKSITDSYRVFALVMPQARIAAAADRAVNLATMETALGAKLKTRIDAAAAAGADVTALNSALTDLATQANGATAAAQSAVSASISLQPDQGDKTVMANNTKALQGAHGDIQTAQKAIVQGRKDIETIIQGLKKINVSATASSTTQVQTQTH
ncbi:MAG TPA: hypothetical protein VIY48_17750 [Candidatus Paceibacterota bacterium]